MRTLVDLPDHHIEQLTRLSAQKKVSRAALIREAVSTYLDRRDSEAMRKAFGIWGDLKMDSVEYQRKLRDEW